jgi:hypothetical protein
VTALKLKKTLVSMIFHMCCVWQSISAKKRSGAVCGNQYQQKKRSGPVVRLKIVLVDFFIYASSLVFFKILG